jgi:hypothetical protein
MGDNEVSDLDTHLFDTSRYDKPKDIGHELGQYTTPDAGGYGWMQTIANLLRASETFSTLIRYIHFIHSGKRREICSIKRKIRYASQNTTSTHNSTNEMDTHADTCCLGKNFIPLYYIGDVCNVHAYSDKLDAIKDVQIGAGATLWTDPSSGSSYILEIHQALMCTDSLEHSLLNPNQIRYDGQGLCDDPWDRHRSLGLVERNHQIFIPFQTRGTVIHFESHVPTTDELHTLPRFVFTEDTLWNPATVSLQPLSAEETARDDIIGNVRTSRVSSLILSNDLIPREPLLTDDSATSDITLVSVSTTMCDETLLRRRQGGCNEQIYHVTHLH